MLVSNVSQEKAWLSFQETEALTPSQLESFKLYSSILLEWNNNINLTSIEEPKSIITHHFKDSLQAKHVIDFPSLRSIADVGAGAGFPGIPLKILYPHLTLYLIEVKEKKREFLAHVCQQLGLENVHLIHLDWRTFLRTTNFSIDLFISRAALQTPELIRIFRHTCPYKEKPLIYWASFEWEVEEKYLAYVQKIEEYSLKKKRRKLVFFGLRSS